MDRIIRPIIVLIYLLSPLPAIMMTYWVNPAAYGTVQGLLPMLLGAAAYTWLMAELVISARPKWIEKYFGLNHFYRFHALTAIGAIVLAFLHKQLEDAIWREFLPLIRTLGNDAFVLFIVLAGLSLFFMTGMLIRHIPFLAAIRRFLEKKRIIDFNLSVLIHNLNVVAILLVFLHVFILSAFYQRNLWICGVYTIYFAIALTYYIYHKYVKIRMASRRPFQVVTVREESPNVHTLVLKRRTRSPKYKSGQFVFLRLLAQGISSEEHPFSLTSDPNDRSTLSVTIKSAGDYTNKVPTLTAGASALIDGPYGVLGNSVHRTHSELVLIAGGIGITPMLSILKDLRHRDPNRRVILLWNVPTKDELIFQNQLLSLAQQMPNFTFIPILSREKNFNGETGRITYEKLARILSHQRMQPRQAHFIICGPSRMMDSVISSLRNLKVDNKRIHFEDFSM
ncbi:MAG: hypothetical protein ABF608_13290 [Sporolactobacillus sp.]